MPLVSVLLPARNAGPWIGPALRSILGQSLSDLEVVHRVTGSAIDPRALAEAIRLSDTKYCSVHATLVPGVRITSRYEIVEEA